MDQKRLTVGLANVVFNFWVVMKNSLRALGFVSEVRRKYVASISLSVSHGSPGKVPEDERTRINTALEGEREADTNITPGGGVATSPAHSRTPLQTRTMEGGEQCVVVLYRISQQES